MRLFKRLGFAAPMEYRDKLIAMYNKGYIFHIADACFLHLLVESEDARRSH